MKNWKTTSTGVVAILTALIDVIHSTASGTPVNWNVDIPAFIGGVGLIAAKDSTTHSTEAQVQVATVEAQIDKQVH